MTPSTKTKNPGLSLGKLSALAQIVVRKPTQVPDAEIELALIDSQTQVRTTFRYLEELAESIKQLGVIEPIILLAKDDGRFRLLCGERRFLAAPLAGLLKIPALVKRGLSEVEIRQIQVAENNDREDLTPYDIAMGVSEDVKNFGFKEAQKIWNRTDSWISKRVAVPKYSEPVLDLLKLEACGDLEVLHSLNQLFKLDAKEFGYMERRLKDRLPLSREDVRNKVVAITAWQKEQFEFDKRRKEAEEARSKDEEETDTKTGNAVEEDTPNKFVASEKTSMSIVKNSADSTPKASAIKVDQVRSPLMEPSPTERAAAERDTLEESLKVLRTEVFEWGDVNLGQFNSLQDKMKELGHDMNETEWVLWSSFLSMALPMLHALGDNRALAYIKRLQNEFKTKTPILMWREQHWLIGDSDLENDDAPREPIPTMPADWRL